MLKRGVAILLVLVLAAALGSCGKKDPPDPAELAAAAKECAENLLSEKYAETGTLKYEVGDVYVSETAAEVQVKIEDKDFVITLTKAEDGSWKGTLPEEITGYLNSLKEENQKAVAKEYAEKLLDAALEDSEGLTYKIGEIKVTGSSADVSAALGEKEFVISLTQSEGGSYTGEVPKELTEYLESLKEDPDEPDKPEPKEDPKPANDPKPKHEHKYTSKVTKEPTCTREGVKTYTCSCGDSYTKPIKAKGHSYKDTVVEPTKTAKGYTRHTCTVCGYEYKDKFTDPIAEDPKPPEDPKPVHTHEWQEVYETIHHDEEGHNEKVCVEEAWDEPVYEEKYVCKVHNKECGAWFDTFDELFEHQWIEHNEGEYCSYTVKDVVTKYIHHDAVYEEKWIVDKPAWDEKELTGYKCKTCGETKGAGGNVVMLPEDEKKKRK